MVAPVTDLSWYAEWMLNQAVCHAYMGTYLLLRCLLGLEAIDPAPEIRA